MCAWMYKVIDHFELDRQIVAISTSLFDRYIAKLSSVENREIKLICLTSLYIAIKTNMPRNLRSIDTFIQLAQGEYSRNEIESMERKMLFALQWLVNPPTAQTFLKYYLEFTEHTSISKNQIHILNEKATYIIEYMIFSDKYPHEKFSSIAMASLIVAMSDIDQNIFSFQDQKEYLCSLEYLTHITLKNIKPLTSKIQLALGNDGIDLHDVSFEIDPDHLLFEGIKPTTQDSTISYNVVPRPVTPIVSPI